MTNTLSLPERFWTKVDVRGFDECWEWKASYRCGRRYGCIDVEGKSQLAHRVMWMLYYGKIAKGMCVLHKCDNTRCVNPNHLWLGTQADNAQDRGAKGRAALGERCGMSKLTVQDAKAIRTRYHNGERQQALATEYNVDDSTISDIVTRKTWRHVG